MKARFLVLTGALALLLAGCQTRSISDSDYRGPWGRGGNPLYKGELSEFDILGLAAKQEATEQNIQAALENSQVPRPKRGDRILWIQSGALEPDAAMMEPATRCFDVAPFSGIPPEEKGGFAASLRLRAAQGGCRYVLCYWGVLESARREKEGAAVSWVPIIGAFVPDQKQEMRIRLKALLVDVRTGAWRMLLPEAYSDEKWTTRLSREGKDQELVEELKRRAYQALVTELLKA